MPQTYTWEILNSSLLGLVRSPWYNVAKGLSVSLEFTPLPQSNLSVKCRDESMGKKAIAFKISAQSEDGDYLVPLLEGVVRSSSPFKSKLKGNALPLRNDGSLLVQISAGMGETVEEVFAVDPCEAPIAKLEPADSEALTAEFKHWYQELFDGIENEQNPLTNVTLKCKEEKNFYSHDVILSANLELRKQLGEKSGERLLDFSEFDANAVKEFLRFFYLRSLEPENFAQIAEDLLCLAKRYQEPVLIRQAEKVLTGKVTDKSAGRLLLLAVKQEAPQLKTKCIEYLKTDLTKLIMLPEYKEIAMCSELMAELLKAEQK